VSQALGELALSFLSAPLVLFVVTSISRQPS
jgi:hypothetical protein